MSETIPAKPTEQDRTSTGFRVWLRSRWFVAAVLAIGTMQVMIGLDGTVELLALPKMQNELRLSDSELSWVIIAYTLTFGGLLLFCGRLGDTLGRKRVFMAGVTLFTLSSAGCGIAWDAGTLVTARLLQGAAAAIIGPASVALIATTFPKGPARNAAAAVFGATAGISAVMGFVVGGALTQLEWRLAFLVNVPVGLLVLYLSRTALRETQMERMRLDATGAVLATLACTAAIFGLSMAPEKGWLSGQTIGSGVVALSALVAFVVVERNAENPIVPFDLFFDRNRLATFATIFLAGGLLFTLTVLIGLYVQNIMGYSALRAGISFIPFMLALGVGVILSSRLVTRFQPRALVIAGGIPVVGAILYSSTLHQGAPYFPNLVVPLVLAGLGIGMVNVPVSLSVIASVGVERIGPTTSIAIMLQSLGAPVVMGVVGAVVASRTRALGGISGPVRFMNPAQFHALDHGYTYGLLWLAGVAVLVGLVALFIGYTAKQVAHAQEAKAALEAEPR